MDIELNTISREEFTKSIMLQIENWVNAQTTKSDLEAGILALEIALALVKK